MQPATARPARLALVTVLVTALATIFCPALTGQAAAADTNDAPTAFVVGPDTYLAAPGDVALDAAGNRYVANVMGESVTVYAPGANGNVAPIREIKGGNTLLTAPRAVMVDPAGRLYVADLNGPGTAAIRIFSAGANGNVAPVTSIQGSNVAFGWPSGMALDPVGRLYVSDRDSNKIWVFPPNAAGNTAALSSLSGPATGLATPRGIAFDSRGRLHVANFTGGSVTSYSPGASGNQAPIRTLSGSATGLSEPLDVAVDSSDNLYVTNISSHGPGPDAVAVFAPDAPGGNTTPGARLVGGNTNLSDPTGVAVDPQRRLSVTNSGSMLSYGPLTLTSPTPAVAAGGVRKLKVAGRTYAAKRLVTWKAPTSSGSAPISGYLVTVTKKKKVLFTKTVSGLRTVLKRKKLKASGRLTATVRAVTSVGPGAPESTTLTVRRQPQNPS